MNRSPFYREPFVFKSSTNGGIVLRVSQLQRDWPAFQIQSQTEAFARSYVTFAKLWLKAHHYSPVSVLIVDGYTQPGQFDWQDDQRDLRAAIMADYIAPSNAGKPLHRWRGLGHDDKTVDLSWIDYGQKTD